MKMNRPSLLCDLHYYVELGNFDRVSEFILQNKGLNGLEYVDLANNTVLHIAAANDNPDIVIFLLEMGANVESINSLGWTPLMQASRHGNCNIVRILLAHRADIHRKNHLGMTALMLACASGDTETVRVIIQAGGKVCEDLNFKNQMSTLMVASLKGNDDIVRLLLDKGVNANISTTKTDLTALMFASAGGNLSTIEILLERGAKVDLVNVGDYTASDIAIINGKPDIANKLKSLLSDTRRKEKVPKDIMEAIRESNTRAVQEILFRDPQLAKTVTLEGETPLMLAAMLGNVPIAQLLLHYDAEINAQDFHNTWTPLMHAIFHGQSTMAKFLIEENADLFLTDHKGQIAFDLANEKLDSEIMKLIAERQSNILMLNENNIGSTSPTVLYMKQLWNKISFATESSKRGTEQRRASYPPVVSPTGSSVTEPPITNISSTFQLVEKLKKIQEDCDDMMRLPPVSPKKEPLPPGSLKDLNNHFTFERVIAKIPKAYQPQAKSSKDILHQANHQKVMNPYQRPKIIVTPYPAETPSSQIVKSNILSTKFPHFITSSLNESMSSLSFSLGSNSLSKLLQKLNLKQHLKRFEEEEIDVEVFLMLKPKDLKEIGIDNPQEINLIMKEIIKLNELKDSQIQ